MATLHHHAIAQTDPSGTHTLKPAELATRPPAELESPPQSPTVSAYASRTVPSRGLVGVHLGQNSAPPGTPAGVVSLQIHVAQVLPHSGCTQYNPLLPFFLRSAFTPE